MKRINKAKLLEIAAVSGTCQEAAEKLTGAVEAYNEGLAALKAPLEAALQAYQEATAGLKELYEGIAQEAREYYDERSERWQEGEEGAAYNEWAEALEGFEIEEIEIDFPEEIDAPEVADFTDEATFPPEEPG